MGDTNSRMACRVELVNSLPKLQLYVRDKPGFGGGSRIGGASWVVVTIGRTDIF